MIYPTALQLSPDNRLLIDWSDGQKRSYRIRELAGAAAARILLRVLALLAQLEINFSDFG